MFFGKKWQFMTNAEEMAQELDREAYGHWWRPQPLIMAMLRGMQRFAEGECVRADFCDAVATLAVDDDAETEPTHDVFFHRRQQTIDEALWRLHVNLGHVSLATMLRHLKHANATPAAMERARWSRSGGKSEVLLAVLRNGLTAVGVQASVWDRCEATTGLQFQEAVSKPRPTSFD